MVRGGACVFGAKRGGSFGMPQARSFAQAGFRGATPDRIATAAGLSKPHVLCCFDRREAIHPRLLEDLPDTWLAPLRAIDPQGGPVAKARDCVRRKLEMAREFPSQSRLFADEILRGAPDTDNFIRGDPRARVDDIARLVADRARQAASRPWSPST